MTLLRNPRSGIYEADIKDRSIGRLHCSLRTRVKKDATPRHDAVEALVRDGRTDLVELLRRRKIRVEAVETCRREKKSWDTLLTLGSPWPSVGTAARDYLHWLSTNENRHGNTAKTASSQLKRFTAFVLPEGIGGAGSAVADLTVDAVSTEQIEAYQRSLSSSPPNTRTAYVARIGTLYRWLQRREEQRAKAERRAARVLHIPLDPETQPRGRTARQRWLSEDEIERLIASTPPQLLAPVCLGLLAGLRINEALHLRVTDVDLQAGRLWVREKEWTRDGNGRVRRWRPKSGEQRDVPLTPALWDVLRSHVTDYSRGGWLVPSPSVLLSSNPQPFGPAFEQHFRLIVERAGMTYGRATPEGVTFHTLRHTFASHLVTRGVDLYTVAKLLGNTLKMVETTYGHLAPEHRRKAVDRLAGLVPPSAAPSVIFGTRGDTEHG